MVDRLLPWFHCYPEKWLGALSEMPPDLGYVYIVVCLRIYEKRGPIPDGVEALARRTGFRPSHVGKLIEKLCALGKLRKTSEGFLMNPFAEREIVSGEEIASTTSKNRSRAAKISWEKRKENQSPVDTPAMQIEADLDLDKDSGVPRGTPRGGVDSKTESPKAEILPPLSADADLFRRGREVLGKAAGGMIKNLLDSKGGSVPHARAAIEAASTKDNPRQYVAAMIHGPKRGGSGFAMVARRLYDQHREDER